MNFSESLERQGTYIVEQIATPNSGDTGKSESYTNSIICIPRPETAGAIKW